MLEGLLRASLWWEMTCGICLLGMVALNYKSYTPWQEQIPCVTFSALKRPLQRLCGSNYCLEFHFQWRIIGLAGSLAGKETARAISHQGLRQPSSPASSFLAQWWRLFFILEKMVGVAWKRRNSNDGDRHILSGAMLKVRLWSTPIQSTPIAFFSRRALQAHYPPSANTANLWFHGVMEKGVLLMPKSIIFKCIQVNALHVQNKYD